AGYIFAALPIRGSDTGDYLVRNLLGVDAGNKMIAIGEHLTTGDGLQFCRRDRKSAREDLERMLHDLLARTGKPARAALYYSCLGRGPHMFGEDSAEVRMVQEALGDVPLVGFFCNGEISHRRLYGYTGVLTLFT
ncbi:MAG: FIST C-terminal domain-containing protein, partial [Pseudomonadota bacterium]